MGMFTQIATINENLRHVPGLLYMPLFIVSHLILTRTSWEHKSTLSLKSWVVKAEEDGFYVLV